MGALPLRDHPRVWGCLSLLELPVWLCPPYCFWFYALGFGCDLDETEPGDLTTYASLGHFFYQGLGPGALALQVSPADGTILHFSSTIDILGVEQVKGITYSLDALLGAEWDIGTNTNGYGICARTRVGRSSRLRYRQWDRIRSR